MAVRMSGLVSGLDTESIVKELMSAQRLKSTKIEKNITKMEWKQEKWKTLNSKIYSFYTGSLSKIKMEGNFETKKVTSSNETKLEVKASGTVPEGTQNVKVTSAASAQFITGSKLGTSVAATSSTKLADLDMASAVGSSILIAVGKKSTSFDITSSTTIADFTAALSKAGLNASFDAGQQRFFISSKESGYENAFSIKAADTNVDMTKLGLSDIVATLPDTNGVVDVTVGSNVSLVKPSDAVIVYNGAEIRSSSNTIAANGLTFTVKGVTDEAVDEEIKVNVTKDTQAVYDMVKDFVKNYNELLKEMNDGYDADVVKGYEPLTDEEKEAMSEDQITKWEDKIKASLLRRDGTLNSVVSSMRTNFSKSVDVDGKKYSLSSFGIAALDYTEQGLLHIEGDEDDTLASTEENKLLKALTENPDAVKEVFNTLASELYSDMTDKMKSTSLRSALTFYNDKEMKKTIDNHKEDLAELEDRLVDMESRYYKQFTAMETMMSKLNAQSSSLASLLGTGTSS